MSSPIKKRAFQFSERREEKRREGKKDKIKSTQRVNAKVNVHAVIFTVSSLPQSHKFTALIPFLNKKPAALRQATKLSERILSVA